MKTALFDFDGVVVDTEPIYDIFWNAAAEKYKVGIDNFAHVIKGTTLPFIMEKYFSDFPQALRQQIHDESIAYEKDMPIALMPGSLEFIRMLKANGERRAARFGNQFRRSQGQAGVPAPVARRAVRYPGDGRPDYPEQARPDVLFAGSFGFAGRSGGLPGIRDCLVFEDSFAGIGAATRAGMRVIGIRVIEMRVIGLSTTNPAESLKGKVYKVIPDFREVTIEDYSGW